MAFLLGRRLIPWQSAALDVASEILPSGRFAYPVVVWVVPRRAGKTIAVLAKVLERLQIARMTRAWYTAQRREDAAKQFRDEWVPLLELSPLAPKLHVRRAQGSEGFTFRANRSRLQLFAPSETALHGQNADDVNCDEAWYFDVDEGAKLEAGIRPAQVTRPWRQLWIVSAGGTELSSWLDGWMTVGRAGVDDGRRDGVCYLEYSADPHADDYDPAAPATWRRAHPGLGFHVDEAALAGDLETMGLALFERSYLNVWDRPSEHAVSNIDPAAWHAAAGPGAPADPVVFGIDVSPDRAWSAVGVAGAGGRSVLELVEHRRGVDWLVPFLREIRAAHRGAPIMARAVVAAGIVAELTRARIPVDVVGSAEYTSACVTLVDRLNAGTVAHRAQAELDLAALGAARRNAGDAWAWSGARSAVDITPLVAVTLAVWRQTTRVTPGRPKIIAAGR